MSRFETAERRGGATMTGSLRLARVAGFDIFIHWSWLFIFALVTWSLMTGYLPAAFPAWSDTAYLLVAAVTSLFFFGSVLLHELAHSFEARRRGLVVASITLFMLGGVSSLGGEPRRARDEFWIAIVGPLMSVVLAVVAAGVWLVARAQGVEAVAAIAGYLAMINLGLGIFNLLPGFPLDGGRVFRSIVWGKSGNLLTATRHAARVGKVIAGLLIAFGLLSVVTGGIGGLWTALIGWFLWNAAGDSAEQQVVERALDGLTVGDLARPIGPMLAPDVTLEQLAFAAVRTGEDTPFFVGVAGGEPLGVITRATLASVPRETWGRTSVYRAMTPRERLVGVGADTMAATALRLMTERPTDLLIVVEGREARGLLTREALLRAVERRARTR